MQLNITKKFLRGLANIMVEGDILLDQDGTISNAAITDSNTPQSTFY